MGEWKDEEEEEQDDDDEECCMFLSIGMLMGAEDEDEDEDGEDEEEIWGRARWWKKLLGVVAIPLLCSTFSSNKNKQKKESFATLRLLLRK
jgi:hypothetical protein